MMILRSSRVRSIAAVAAVVGVLAGCGGGGKESAPTPQTDDEKITALYEKLYDAIQDRDQAKFLQLICPSVRSEIEPEAWFNAASKLPKPDTAVTNNSVAATATTAAPSGSQWRNVDQIGTAEMRLRIVKIDSDWYVCET